MHRNRSGQYDGERGFTLIEMLLTITILTCMLAIIMPVVQYSVQRMQERQYIEQLTADLYWAASEARCRQSTITINFAADASGYTIRTAYGQPLKQAPLPVGFRLYHNFQGLMVYFNELGHISRAGTIRLINPEGKERKVVLYIASGRFQVDGGSE
ncbi:competence type IV pilus minor pilin ComGD [Aneurinibacillus uraniidurans]|uniref:competence type IV pilus minor pilin ComGD n=1 Tax=Aneurinibacillus uraniidurans TaxID=2966586 RepID=UPI00234A7707|nr:competence type IV pilus minor pilin ComGD [Aneurinibacillus sp. B1]WCN38876.1 competence type IV pilus minor pilin ComGD [Aneurinibacillus sp. B1]